MNFISSFIFIPIFRSPQKLYNNRKANFKGMDVFNKEKYSIKKKLHDHLQSMKQNVSLTDIKNSNRHIYTPEHEGFFLRTVQKQIKHEGSILKRIKKKIYEFKDAKLKKKQIKNSASHYLQSMFSPSSIKNYNSQKVQTLEQTTAHSSPLQSPHRQIYSSNTTKRDHSKIKFGSFAACKGRNVFEQNQANPQKKSYRQSQQRMERLSRRNFEQNGVNRQKKKPEENVFANSNLDGVAFSLSGTKPQWSNFESYRNYNTKKKQSLWKMT